MADALQKYKVDACGWLIVVCIFVFFVASKVSGGLVPSFGGRGGMYVCHFFSLSSSIYD